MHVHAYCREIDMYPNWEGGLGVGDLGEQKKIVKKYLFSFFFLLIRKT